MITLTKDMEVGVAMIDAQHRELVDRLNSVVAMGAKSVTQEETQRTLDFLAEYVARHFTEEEELQRRSGYPKYAQHKGEHRLLIGEFRKLQCEFAANGVSAKFTVSLNNSIIKWIVRHIKSADAEFGKYYQAQGASRFADAKRVA